MGVLLCCVLLFVVYGFIDEAHAEATSCPTCLHLNISMTGVPKETEQMLKNILGSMSNADCLAGGPSVQISCQSTVMTTTKCQTATINARAEGIKGAFPNAVLNQVVVFRSCAQRPLAEADKCVDLKDVPERQRQKMLSSLENVKQQWESFDFSGQTCYKGSGGVYTSVSKTDTKSDVVVQNTNQDQNQDQNQNQNQQTGNQNQNDGPAGGATGLYSTAHVAMATILGALLAAMI